jgi:hypothetical protein
MAVAVKTDSRFGNPQTLHHPRMSSYNTRASAHVTTALENYGAKTFGSFPRRLERLQRFNDVQNKKYAEQIREENERANAAEVVWPALTITREVSPRYNLRSTTRAAQDLLYLSRAIENGHVTTRRG